MENRDNMYAEVERYLDGDMSPEEIKDFEARIQENTALSEVLNIQQEAREAVLLVTKDQRRQQVKEWLYEVKAPVPLWQRLVPYAGAIAAVLMILISIGAVLQTNCNDLYQSSFTAAEHDSFLGSRGSASPEQQWQTALYFYQKKECDKASQILKALVVDTTFIYTNQANLYLGSCLLEKKLPEESQQSLAYLGAIPSNAEEHPQAQWYTAMAYSQLGDCENTQKSLSEIAGTPGHFKQEAATEFLAKLNRWNKLKSLIHF